MIFVFLILTGFGFLAYPAKVSAATGDITAVRITTDGWYAEVDLEGFVDDGAYNYGLGINNDPATASVVFTVTSEGYNSSGTLGAITRTIYGTRTLREAYPNGKNFAVSFLLTNFQNYHFNH